MEEQHVDHLKDLVGLANQNIIPAEELDRDYKVYPEIDEEKCIGCGRCYISCYDGAHQAIEWNEETRKVSCNKEKCVGCLLCRLVCPVGAISKGEVEMKPGRSGKPEDKVLWEMRRFFLPEFVWDWVRPFCARCGNASRRLPLALWPGRDLPDAPAILPVRIRG